MLLIKSSSNVEIVCAFKKMIVINPSGAWTGKYQANMDKSVAADALAPCVNQSSRTICSIDLFQLIFCGDYCLDKLIDAEWHKYASVK